MARAKAEKNYNNLLGGYVTQGNEFEPPKHAIRDGRNVEIIRTGGVKRRLGINREDTATSDKQLVTTVNQTNPVVQMCWDWHEAGGDPDSNFLIRQCGRYLWIYEKGQDADLAQNYVTQIDLNTFFFTGSSYSDTRYNPIQISIVQGMAVVHGVAVKGFVITYDPIGDSFTTVASAARSLIRDYEGLDDELDVDTRPQTQYFTYSGLGGTSSLVVGDIIEDDTSGERTVIVAVDLGGTRIWHTDSTGSDYVAGHAFTTDNGTTGTVGTVFNAAGGYSGFSVAHYYNLLNQGWPPEHIDTYTQNVDAVLGNRYGPSNAQQWFAGKDSSGDFDPAELDKVDFGTSAAPNGHIILTNTDRQTDRKAYTVNGLTPFSLLTSADPDESEARASAVFAGRVFQAGWFNQRQQSQISFSPVLSEVTPAILQTNPPIAINHTQNDPTSEFDNQVLATDGGVIGIPDIGVIHRLLATDIALLIFASNGVWALSGADIYTGFTSTSFTIKKVSKFGCTAPNAVVEVDDVAIYWSDTAIHAIYPSDQPGAWSKENLTVDRIDDVYTAITKDIKDKTIGYYDRWNKKIYWAYQRTSTLSDPELRDGMLIFDSKLKIFYPPYETAQVDNDKDNDPMFGGFTQDQFYASSSGIPTLKILTHLHDESAGTIDTSFSEFRDTNYIDWLYADATGEYMDSWIQSWADHLGDPIREKQAPYVFCYFKKTEDGYQDNGSGGLELKNQSGCLLRGYWEWHTTTAGGRVTSQQQVYRFKRLYVPADVNDDFDTGESIIVTKSKLRGKGRALAVEFYSQDGKDFQLLGYSIPYTTGYLT